MKFEELKNIVKNVPETSGIYKFIDKNEQTLYVGKAKNLRKRLTNYTQPERLNKRIARMVNLATKLDFIQTQNELEALLLEHNLIKKLAPHFNILLRDSKTFPYISIGKNHLFPRLAKHRGVKSQSYYFGPFAQARDVNKTIDILKKSFLLRTCTDQEFKASKKPCLEYQIKKCSAPCVNYISREDYQKLVADTVNFLNGKSTAIQESLNLKMAEFSKNEEFEKALVVRDKIRALATIQAQQNINIDDLGNSDVIVIIRHQMWVCVSVSFYRNGNNYGSKPYFYNIANENFAEENQDNLANFLWEFLGQFYLENQAPQIILLNLMPLEAEAENMAPNQHLQLFNDFINQINSQNDYKVKVKIANKGNNLKLIQDLEFLAKQLTEQKIVSTASNQGFLQAIKELFNLQKTPQKIEVYDNSHTAGTNQVGVLIVTNAEGFIKNDYRKFNVKDFNQYNIDNANNGNANNGDANNGNDLAILEQILTRRFTNYIQEKLPDFIIIDGGLTHLNVAFKVFKELEINIPFICMSKGKDRNSGLEDFHFYEFDEEKQEKTHRQITLPKNHLLKYYLQRLRDEAHRFAITTHRQKRGKEITKSSLDDIEGIGASRKKKLLQYFGSVEKIKTAKVADLERVEGISKKIAIQIHQFFN